MNERTLRRMVVGLSIATTILFICVVLLLTSSIDRAVSMTYLRASQEYTEITLKTAIELLDNEWNGITLNELHNKLDMQLMRDDGMVMVDENLDEGFVSIEGIKIYMENGVVKKVGTQ